MPTINKVKRPWHSANNTPYRRKPKKDSFYSNQPWRKLRRIKLMQDPLCEKCKQEGIIKEATIVDHHRPRRFYPELELELSNLKSLCKSHHESKSSNESRINSKENYESIWTIQGNYEYYSRCFGNNYIIILRNNEVAGKYINK